LTLVFRLDEELPKNVPLFGNPWRLDWHDIVPYRKTIVFAELNTAISAIWRLLVNLACRKQHVFYFFTIASQFVITVIG
jgi:hypothetical protein